MPKKARRSGGSSDVAGGSERETERRYRSVAEIRRDFFPQENLAVQLDGKRRTKP